MRCRGKLLLRDSSKRWLHYFQKIILLLLFSNGVQVLQLYSLQLIGLLAVEILQDPEAPKYCVKEGFFFFLAAEILCEVEDREVTV